MCARLAAHVGLLQILLILAGLAQAAAGQSYFARPYTEADGLPHQHILDIAQTSDGLLWFATYSGLATYDGRQFRPTHIGELPSRRYQLDTDESGRLLAFELTPPYRGHILTDGEWRALPHNSLIAPDVRPSHLKTVRVMTRNGENFTLLGANGGHLFLLGPEGWQRIPTQASSIHSICRTHDEFVVVSDKDVYTLSIDKPEAGLTPIPGAPPIGAIAAHIDPTRDSCWILGRTWIGEYRRGTFELRVPEMDDKFFPELIDIAMLPDEHGGLFFGERTGCQHWSPTEGLEVFPSTNDLDDIGITQMMRDREGIIWSGGVRGVAKFAGRSLVNRYSHHGMAEDEVSAILQLRDGRMVLGHDKSVTILGNPTRTITLDKSAAYTRVMSMVQAKDGTIVAAASRAGLLRINPDTLDVEIIPPPDLPTTSNLPQLYNAQAVDLAPNGDILVTGWLNAWWLRGDETEDVGLSTLPMAGKYLRQAVADGDSVLCAARDVGVIRFSRTAARQWTGESRAMRNVTCVTRRPDGTIWAGSAAGLLTTKDDGSLDYYDFAGDRITRPVYSITDDLQGRTWFGTNDGVTIWNGERLREITSDNGLAGRETNRGANCCDRDGRVWVGFDRGLTTFHLDREVAPRHGPTIAFLPPAVDGVITTDDSWQQLKNHRSIGFRLQSISTRDEDRLQHQYRLEGLNEDWSPKTALPDNNILYHNLPAGRYRLHVRATDSAGLSTAASSPWLEVMPPWWRSWWFYIAATAAALAVIGGIIMFTSQRRNTHTLKSLVAERTANLTTERNRLRAMLASIADGVIGIDKDGIVRLWNTTATQLTGWTKGEMLGKPLDGALPALDAPRSTQPGQPVQVVTQSGTTRWFEYTTAPVATDTDSGYVIAFRDVTDRRQQERLLTRTERLESLGILAGGIAHDFNNLLTVMLGNLSLLELEELPSEDENHESEQLHDQIREAVLRARDLTQQLLTFSKGGAPVRKLGSLAAVAVESTQLALSGANVRSETSMAPDLHEVEFDFGQISQVVHNLVLNARQAMPEGGTVVVRGYNVDCSPQGTMAKYAVIEVRDVGSGIDPGELEHIFDPYYSTKPEGTGLGLATSHSIVKRHDGFLTAESRVGTGTTLRIYLPAGSRDDVPPTSERPEIAATASATPSNRHVLCMDDDGAIRSVMAASMQTLGHRALVVADGAAAVAAYRQAIVNNDPFDYVLLDLTVPGGMGGIDTLTELQQINPDVVAIATTGYSTEPIRAEFEQHGFCVMLSKPFGIRDVDAALSQAAELGRPDAG